MTNPVSSLKGGPPFSWIMKVNICGCPALWMCRGFGTCLCRTLCRTEQIRMKYWVHLWISGAERPLVGASACIFSWWKPLDGSFLLAASLKSESQKCNASWRQKKRPRYIEVERWWGFSLLQLKSRLWRSTLAPKIVSQKKKKKGWNFKLRQNSHRSFNRMVSAY